MRTVLCSIILCLFTGLYAVEAKEILRILSWNVQNLFDAQHDGSEYLEFSPRQGWSKDLYSFRLRKISSAIMSLALQPDLIALQEVEHIGVVSDLARHLPDYSYFAASSSSGAIQVALLSRYPFAAVRQHATQYRDMFFRAILEVEIDISTEQFPVNILHVFVNHWKSRRNGAEESELYRRMQAQTLRYAVQDVFSANSRAGVICIGDFNESPNEYYRVHQKGENYQTAFHPAGVAVLHSADPPADFLEPIFLQGDAPFSRGLDSVLVLYSPWLDASFSVENKGSYYYQGQWEQIDGVLLSPVLASSVRTFQVVESRVFLSPEGTPRSWKRWEQNGMSDHLPILLTISK